MKVEYDNYYQTENLFGEPYPELLDFYTAIEQKGKLLDVGCGQGRDAIALAKLGFEVTGIDYSKVGIEQLNTIAKKENLPLTGLVADIFTYEGHDTFDFILLDSMFHFGKKEKQKEIDLLKRIFSLAKQKAVGTICIQNSEKKVAVLKSIISEDPTFQKTHSTELVYEFIDQETDHRSKTAYLMISVQKE